jgi:ABC-type transport system substrate-binding protein
MSCGIQQHLAYRDPVTLFRRDIARQWYRQAGWTLAVIVLAITSCVTVNAQDEESAVDNNELPTLSSMNRPPSFAELIDAERFDWLILRNSEYVIVCDPLEPRPNTYEQIIEKRKKLLAISRRSAEEAEQLSKLKLLQVNLPGDLFDYQIKLEDVKGIVGIEQLTLERIDLLIEEGATDKAYDLLQRLEYWLPDWDQAAPRFNKMLFKETEKYVQDGKSVAAMALLEQLHDRNPEFPQLSDTMGQLILPLIRQAVEQSNYQRAQWLIRRLSRRFADHAVVDEWKQVLRQRSDAKMKESLKLAQESSHREAAEVARAAGLIWPRTGKSRADRADTMSRHQRVRVAVRSLVDHSAFPIALGPEQRHHELVSVPLFEADTVNEITHYRSGFVEEWDPQDLGRVVTISLRTSHPYWQPQPQVSASQVADALAARLNPASPDYDPRLDSFVAGYSVRSPSTIEIRFSRVPLNLAALFRFPVKLREPGGTGESIPTGRFRLSESDERHRSYLRRIPEPDGLNSTQYHVAEITELKYDTRHEDIQAFRRGHVDVLPYLQTWEVDPIRESKLGFVQNFATPANHVIVFNPESNPIRNAQLRRALSLAVPREVILKKIILRDESMKYGRPSSATWSSKSYASNPLMDSPKFDLRLAFALKFAAEEQLRIPEKQKLVAEAREATEDAGETWNEAVWKAANAAQLQEATQHIELPVLVMLCEPDTVMQLAAEKMVDFWSRIGIQVRLVVQETTDEAVPTWDMMYRRVQMEEPLLDLWPVLLTDQSLDVNLLDGYPDWMRQDLTRLDYAGSFRAAQKQLFRIQKYIASQAFLIPLWEVDQFIAFRSNVTGYRDRPLSVYDNVQRWVVKP